MHIKYFIGVIASFFFFALSDADPERELLERKLPLHSINLVDSITQIKLEEFPNAFNPSLLAVDSGFLMTFRYMPEPKSQPWVSYIGIVQLDHDLNFASQPELLDTRQGNSVTPSQAEDARIFRYRGQIYLIYNDNQEIINPTTQERRDMYLAELLYANGSYVLGTPLKLIHETKYSTQNWQKNWIPFEWNNQLMLAYSINPHEILCADLNTGICKTVYETKGMIDWDWGPLRGSSSPILEDGEFIAFLHSGCQMRSESSNNKKIWHYFMGAYTFSATPPFKLTKISPFPINAKGFYTKSDYDKRVIFPGGFAISGLDHLCCLWKGRPNNLDCNHRHRSAERLDGQSKIIQLDWDSEWRRFCITSASFFYPN